jgi:hypothetical protein
MYCEAAHKNATEGCYGFQDHTGKHWAFVSTVTDRTGAVDDGHGSMIWEWDREAPEVPAGSAALVLTDNEISVMLASLVGLEAVIPGLAKPILEKLNAAREGIK